LFYSIHTSARLLGHSYAILSFLGAKVKTKTPLARGSMVLLHRFSFPKRKAEENLPAIACGIRRWQAGKMAARFRKTVNFHSIR